VERKRAGHRHGRQRTNVFTSVSRREFCPVATGCDVFLR
jgi:hypothetical protein